MNAVIKRESRQQLIRAQARHLQLTLWNRRFELWGDDAPSDPIDVLQPAVALKVHGFDVESCASLGYADPGMRTEVAGAIHRADAKVFVSAKYSFTAQNFTLAHELGHVLLHPHIDVKHREISKDGPGASSYWEEREADRFATEFLMPGKRVREEFSWRFGPGEFQLTDESAFLLCASTVDRLLARFRAPRDLSKMLAEGFSFGGVSFPSLAKRFSVSGKAMAIRLDELGLVAL